MSKIIQISDIHIGGEYDGQFDCWGNLETVLKAASTHVPKDIFGFTYPLVIVSGDVCDGDAATTDNYKAVDDMVKKYLGKNVIYTVGNHDNAKVMGETLGFDPDDVVAYVANQYDSPYILFHIPTYSGTVDPSAITERIMRWISAQDDDIKKLPRYAYSHFPIGHVDHRFMQNGHALEHGDDLAERLGVLGIKDVFCGHYHMGITTHPSSTSPWVNVCPATQCQLDPYSKDCKPTGDYPGYAVIDMYSDYADVKYRYVAR